MQSGDNLQALRKNLDFIRLGSIMLLLIHFYSACYPAWRQWKLTAPVVDRIIGSLSRGVFFMSGIDRPKLACLILLAISLVGEKGKKDEKLTLAPVLYYIFAGLLLFFLSSFFLQLSIDEAKLALLYIAVTSLGWLSILSGGARLSRLLRLKFSKDVFNELNETFPQEERLLENEYSVNLPAQYKLKNKIRKSYINFISPFRALLVLGTPGSIRQILLRDPPCDHTTHPERIHSFSI
jgi:YWFCY motif protein